MIFVIDDDTTMAECLARACRPQPVKIFSNAIEAMQALDQEVPQLIFLDILLDGPDGFTFLNEMASYPDTQKIPVVIFTSLDLVDVDLANYGVVAVLNKSFMTPGDIQTYVQQHCA